MNILVHLVHPAHFHLYKNAMINWQNNGHNVFIVINAKDSLEGLLKNSNLPYFNVSTKKRDKKKKFLMMYDIFVRTLKIVFFSFKNKIDILTGSSVEAIYAGWFLRKPAIGVGEDDDAAIPLYTKAVDKFLKIMLVPTTCDKGKLNDRTVKYSGYQELAYLHPNHFTPDKKIVEKYFSVEKNYFIIRFAKLNAHHDSGIQGINTETAQKIVDILKPHGDIYITSERELEPQFEQYRIKINPLDMHHVMAFAQIYIGDSQTMAAEAGVLGVPFVRFNDFVGRIGYLRELEEYYNLGYGIKTNELEKLYSTVNELVTMNNRKEIFEGRRKKMLSEKIDYAKFLTWFIENYPESKKIMQENAEFQT